ncbi:MAG: hypothetical protein V4494_07970 [Chlamydiota bacterium]
MTNNNADKIRQLISQLATNTKELERVTQARSELDDLYKKVDQQHQDFKESSKTTIEFQENEINKLKIGLENQTQVYQQKIKDLQNDLTTSESSYLNLDNYNKTLTDELDKKKQELITLHDQLDTQQLAINNSGDATTNLLLKEQNMVRTLELEIASLETIIQETKDTLDRKEKTVLEVRATIITIEEEYTTKTEKLKTKTNNLRANLEKNKRDLDIERENNKQLKDLLDNKHNELPSKESEDWESSFQTQYSTIKNLEIKNRELDDNLIHLSFEHDNLKTEHYELLGQLQKLKLSIAELQNKESNIIDDGSEKPAVDREALKQAIEQEKARLNQYVEDHLNNNQAYLELLTKHNEFIKKYNARDLEFQEKLALGVAKIKELTITNRQFDKLLKNDEKYTKLSEHIDKLENQVKELDHLNSTIEFKDGEIKRLNNNNADLRRQLQDQENTAKKIEELTKQNAVLNSTNTALINQEADIISKHKDAINELEKQLETANKVAQETFQSQSDEHIKHNKQIVKNNTQLKKENASLRQRAATLEEEALRDKTILAQSKELVNKAVELNKQQLRELRHADKKVIKSKIVNEELVLKNELLNAKKALRKSEMSLKHVINEKTKLNKSLSQFNASLSQVNASLSQVNASLSQSMNLSQSDTKLTVSGIQDVNDKLNDCLKKLDEEIERPSDSILNTETTENSSIDNITENDLQQLRLAAQSFGLNNNNNFISDDDNTLPLNLPEVPPFPKNASVANYLEQLKAVNTRKEAVEKSTQELYDETLAIHKQTEEAHEQTGKKLRELEEKLELENQQNTLTLLPPPPPPPLPPPTSGKKIDLDKINSMMINKEEPGVQRNGNNNNNGSLLERIQKAQAGLQKIDPKEFNNDKPEEMINAITKALADRRTFMGEDDSDNDSDNDNNNWDDYTS